MPAAQLRIAVAGSCIPTAAHLPDAASLRIAIRVCPGGGVSGQTRRYVATSIRDQAQRCGDARAVLEQLGVLRLEPAGSIRWGDLCAANEVAIRLDDREIVRTKDRLTRSGRKAALCQGVDMVADGGRLVIDMLKS